MQYTNRISCIRSKLAHLEIEALLFFDMKNIRYLTGFSGSDGALIVGKNKSLLMVDGRYITQAKGEVKKAEIVEYNDKIEGIVREVTESGLQKVGFESGATSFDSYLSLRDKLVTCGLVLVTLTHLRRFVETFQHGHVLGKREAGIILLVMQLNIQLHCSINLLVSHPVKLSHGIVSLTIAT